MSFRGGRGRGRGYGRGYQFGKNKPEEPVELFPNFVGGLPDIKGVPEEKTLAIWNAKMQNYLKSSPYYLEETTSKKNESVDIERFSDWGKQTTKSRRNTLDQFLLLKSDNFPRELIRDSRSVQRNPKRVRWNPDSGLQKLNSLEDLDKKLEGKEDDEEEKGEDDEEDEGERSDEEFSDDGDYNQNRDFDDDEDDYNADDGDDDEPVYE